MQEIITEKVATVDMLMGTMLDALEGREDMLPEKWIAELEYLEEGVGRWGMDGERVVLEGRLRLEEMIIQQSRIEEEACEREQTLLVFEQGRSAQEGRAEEDAAMEVRRLAEKARLELEAEKVAEVKRLRLRSSIGLVEAAGRQRRDAQGHEEESAAAKALEEPRDIEAERANVAEAAHQVFVREQAGFDDEFRELDRQRRLAEDERMRLADITLAEREKAREAKQQRERKIEERVKVETSALSSPTDLSETMEEGMLLIELSEKVAKRKISRDPTRSTSTPKSRSVAPRRSRPALGKALRKDQKQRFTLDSSSSAPSTTGGYKLCIVSGFGSINADYLVAAN